LPRQLTYLAPSCLICFTFGGPLNGLYMNDGLKQ
jgi:hypothetical protein